MKCPCDKKCFRNMRTAHKAVERIMLEGGPQMRPYRCEYGAIHLTSQPTDFYWNGKISEAILTCKNCGEVQPNEVEFIDHGIGAYEYGSIKAVHHDYQLTCRKCGGGVDNDWELNCLDDGWE